MIVCICNALRESDVAAAASGADQVGQVFQKCGRRPQCGKCFQEVARIIDEQRPDAESIATVVAE